MATTAVQKSTAVFLKGMEQGKKRIFRDKLRPPCNVLHFQPGEEGMIEVIQNLIYTALAGELSEEQLHQDVGIVVGYAMTYKDAF